MKMKTKTKTKIKKIKVVQRNDVMQECIDQFKKDYVMQECIDQFKKDFNRMRKEKDYKTLGEMFWLTFVLHSEGEFREAAVKLFDSLSKKEIALLDSEA
jgi:hypothetical protein